MTRALSSTAPMTQSRSQVLNSPAQTIWEKVTVREKKPNGTYHTDKQTGRIKEFTFIQDKRTGELYWNENEGYVRVKCVALVGAIPFYTLGMMGWYLGRTVWDVAAIGLGTIRKLNVDLAQKKLCQGAADLLKGFVWDIPKAVLWDLWNIVRAPFFAIAALGAALYGTFDPYEGRKLEGKVEKAWQHNVSHHEDFRKKNPKHLKDDCEAFFYGIKHAQACYLAYCFQVRGNINEPRFKRVYPKV